MLSKKKGDSKLIMKELIRKIMWKLCGAQKLQDQIDTQYYYINSFLDVSRAPDAEGDLALLQTADIRLLSVLDIACQKLNLTYWLAYGTLLGAIRHKGFIPWDDDQDVEMPRADYEKAKILLPEFLSPYGIDAYWDDDGIERICVSYKHEMTGAWIDIFPVESMKISKKEESTCTHNELITTYRRKVGYLKETHLKNYGKKQYKAIANAKEKLFSYDQAGETYLYPYPNTDNYWVLKETDIFPLDTIEYKWGGRFPIPHAYDDILTQIYGNYMSFPKSGILHHDMGRGALCEWHKKYDIDMNGVIHELENIYSEINK